MPASHLISYACLITGLSMLAGWWVAFRNRPYLGLLGLSFLSLAGYVMAREAVAQAVASLTPNPLMGWVEIAALVICVMLFAAATVAAVKESQRRMREVREHFRAVEEGLMAMLEEERRRKQNKDGGKNL
jgi:hypothetical protein